MSATSFVRPSYIIQHQNFEAVYSTLEEAKPHSLQQLQASHSVHSLASPCSTDLAMSLESTSHAMPNEVQISVNHGTQAMTKQQWDNLKPLIEQIYIEENRPFPYLAEVLRKDHGFELKKRQFARKIDEWGFRKNISRGERRVILQRALTYPPEEAEGFRDRRLKPRKLNNWRKRYREELPLGTFALGLAGGRIQATPTSGQTSISANTHHSNGPRDEYSPELNEVREDNSDSISRRAMRQNKFDWSRLDDPGLPELVPLLTALRLESAAADQSSPLDEAEIEDPSCLRNSELQDISSSGRVSVIDSIDSCLLLYKPESEDSKHEAKNNSPQYPWRNIENVFFGYITSPLNEIYVFPPSQASLRTKKASAVDLWACLTEETSKLEVQFGKHNPAVMAIIEKLSSLYCRLDVYGKAEHMKRKLVDVYFQVLGPNNGRTLEAAICMVEILLAQGQHLNAKTANDALRLSILKLVNQDHPLAFLVNYTHARICSGSGMSEEAEKYYRQHLQVMLSLHGPRAVSTIKAMSSLGNEIGSRSPEEADILLRIAAQLSFELPAVDEVPCRSLRFIVNKLRSRGAYEESYQLATMLVEKFSLPLGHRHPTIRKARERLAWSMTTVGRLPESIQLFRAIISKQSERGEEIDQSHVNPWCGLADALVETGELDEASMWYKRAFETRLELYGASNKITVYTAYRLGYCYCKQYKYVEAVNIYSKMVHLLRESGNETKAVPDFEAYILYAQKRIVGENSMLAESLRP